MSLPRKLCLQLKPYFRVINRFNVHFSKYNTITMQESGLPQIERVPISRETPSCHAQSASNPVGVSLSQSPLEARPSDP